MTDNKLAAKSLSLRLNERPSFDNLSINDSELSFSDKKSKSKPTTPSASRSFFLRLPNFITSNKKLNLSKSCDRLFEQNNTIDQPTSNFLLVDTNQTCEFKKNLSDYDLKELNHSETKLNEKCHEKSHSRSSIVPNSIYSFLNLKNFGKRFKNKLNTNSKECLKEDLHPAEEDKSKSRSLSFSSVSNPNLNITVSQVSPFSLKSSLRSLASFTSSFEDIDSSKISNGLKKIPQIQIHSCESKVSRKSKKKHQRQKSRIKRFTQEYCSLSQNATKEKICGDANLFSVTNFIKSKCKVSDFTYY